MLVERLRGPLVTSSRYLNLGVSKKCGQKTIVHLPTANMSAFKNVTYVGNYTAYNWNCSQRP
jgi:hypothetical protein